MFAQNLTEEQRLEKALVSLMKENELIALCGVMMIGKRTINDDIPTARTNGRDEEYGRDFVKTLTDKQLRGVMLHELGHKMFAHVTTWENLYRIDPKRANMAVDYVVNLWVKDLIDAGVNAELPTFPPPLLDEQYRNMTAGQVFKTLPAQSSGQGGGSGDGSGALDQHGWEDAQQMSASEKQELAQEIDSALRQGALAAGKMGSGGDRALGDLLKSEVDWREALRDFIQSVCAGNDFSTWSRPNRRYLGQGFYMPSGISQRIGEIMVAIDTSGSIGQEELSRFLGEVQGICEQVKPERVRLVYWDTSVCREEVYEHHELENLADSTKPAGGGGTDAACIPMYITEKRLSPQAVVVLTDGYVCSWGTWAHPVLWCIVDNDHTTAPVGTTIHVKG